MIDFSQEPKKSTGGLFRDKDFTTSDSKWIDETNKKGTFSGVYFQTTFVGVDDVPLSKNFLFMESGELRDKYGIVVNDEGALEKIDEDKPDPEPYDKNEAVKLFNSALKAGVSAKIVKNIGEDPSAFDGFTFHITEESKGFKRKDKDGQETQYDATWVVVDKDGLIASPGGKKSAAKPAASAAASKAKGKPAPVEEPEEKEEDEEMSDVEQAAIATVQAVLPNPKKFVATFNTKQHGGGVTMAQMGAAALGNAIPKDHKGVNKAEVSKLLRKPEIGEKYNGELWNFDAEDGVYSAID